MRAIMRGMAFIFSCCLFGTAHGSDWATGANGRYHSADTQRVAQEVTARAIDLVGVRYRWGGESPEHGFDCSGLVHYVFRGMAKDDLPRTSAEISRVGQKVKADELRPGDLVFFNTRRRIFSHVGIYLGDNRFVHAPRAGAKVRIEDMDLAYWRKRFNGARRILSAQYQDYQTRKLRAR